MTGIHAGIFEEIGSIVWNVDAWNGAIEPKRLDLGNMHLDRIKPGAFRSKEFASTAKHVTVLDVSRNNLGTLEVGVFDGLTSLETVSIYGNRRGKFQCADIPPMALQRADGAPITCEA